VDVLCSREQQGIKDNMAGALTLYPRSFPRIVSLVSGTPVQVAYADVAEVMRMARSRGAPMGTGMERKNAIEFSQPLDEKKKERNKWNYLTTDFFHFFKMTLHPRREDHDSALNKKNY